MGKQYFIESHNLDTDKNHAKVVHMNEYTLYLGDSIQSPNKKYDLIFQQDQNLVLYENVGDGKPRIPKWATATDNTGANRIVFQGDGNIVAYEGNDYKWESGTHKHNEDPPIRMENTNSSGLATNPFRDSAVKEAESESHTWTARLFVLTDKGGMGCICEDELHPGEFSEFKYPSKYGGKFENKPFIDSNGGQALIALGELIGGLTILFGGSAIASIVGEGAAVESALVVEEEEGREIFQILSESNYPNIRGGIFIH